MSIARTTLAYGAVAATCLGLHNAVLIGVDRALHGRVPGLAVLVTGFVLSFLVVSVAGYLLHSRFTFRERVSWHRYGRYALAMSTNTPLAFAATWVLNMPLGLPMAWAAPLASVGMVGVNFLLSRWAIRHPGRKRA
jgi:putative flippase GtrA